MVGSYEYYREDDNFDCFCEGGTDTEIYDAQQKLGVVFDRQYVNFLLKYGAAEVDAFDIYGVKRPKFMSSFAWHVVDRTNFYKQKQQWPDIDDWYVISDDGRGNPIGIDPKGVVWLSDHDSGFEKVKLADDFEEFLYKLLTDNLYE